MEKLRELNPLHDKYGYLSLVVFGAVVLAIGLLRAKQTFFLEHRRTSFWRSLAGLASWAALQ